MNNGEVCGNAVALASQYGVRDAVTRQLLVEVSIFVSQSTSSFTNLYLSKILEKKRRRRKERKKKSQQEGCSHNFKSKYLCFQPEGVEQEYTYSNFMCPSGLYSKILY